MTFVVQVQVEAEHAGEAIQKISSGIPIAVNRVASPQQSSVGQIQGSAFQRTTIQPTPVK